jgi:hypothetical protein
VKTIYRQGDSDQTECTGNSGKLDTGDRDDDIAAVVVSTEDGYTCAVDSDGQPILISDSDDADDYDCGKHGRGNGRRHWK